VLIKLNIIVLP